MVNIETKAIEMPDSVPLPPPAVQWAQRKGLIYISILLEDSKETNIKIQPDQLYFKARGGSDDKEYEVTINLFGEVSSEESKYVVRERMVEFILKKKADGPYWKRLVKEDKKFHYLKVDFNKWKDEDDSDEEGGGGGPGGVGGGQDLEDMFKQMGGLQAGDNSLEGLNADVEEDSDDEELPDLE